MTTRKDIENALMRGADTLRDTIDAANSAPILDISLKNLHAVE